MSPETRAVFRLIIQAILKLLDVNSLHGIAVRQTLLEASRLCDVVEEPK